MLRTYRNSTPIGLVVLLPVGPPAVSSANLLDLPDGSKPPTSEPGWHGFGLVLEDK
jgi:hypothetical protein